MKWIDGQPENVFGAFLGCFLCVWDFFGGVVCLVIWVFRLPLGALSGSLKMGLRFVVGFECGVYHALHASGSLTFLCFAKEK